MENSVQDALDEAYDLLSELDDYFRLLQYDNPNKEKRIQLYQNKIQSVLQQINEELYKTL